GGCKASAQSWIRLRQAGHARRWGNPGSGNNVASAQMEEITTIRSEREANLSAPTDDGAAAGAIQVRDLEKNYGAVKAVRGLDFAVRKSEIFGLIGPDGAGKTTTFQIIAGIMEPTSGSVEVFGHPARDMRSQTGYLTQTFSLYPDLTVLE